MPIGKDSITKRVAKATNDEKNIAPELVATVAAAPKKTPAKKTTSTTAKKTASTTKKPAAPAAPEAKNAPAPAAPEANSAPAKKTSPKSEKKVETTVLANVSPETVKAVIGHAENEKFEKVRIGQKMPDFLL